MRADNKWQDYKLLDATDGYRLESWGGVILVRPDPQIVWKFEKKSPMWEKAHAVYHRSSKGGGEWEYRKKFPAEWNIKYDNMTFKVTPTGFKHTGIFPEQATNWDEYAKMIAKEGRELNILNLFGYTGGATLACAAAGAKVCHVDASKGVVAWGKENAQLSGLSDKPIRWIVDDCIKFVQREIRRGNKYDGIIMDPPSYGRGPNGEVWKLEDNIFQLLELCSQILSDDPLFVAVNSYTTGVSPSVMEYMLDVMMRDKYKGTVSAQEIGLTVQSTGMALPCGSTAFWKKEGHE
ncbi:MAG: class I SAM-dependent methyltransferase [Oscillospiraceae bacterium]|nr:SAM-dependent methyltransferase [Oscillospiraceae bacterium]MBQ6849511.1 class I SAM-dependent methyltransferase [Oscillospiraceae bacterium]